MITDEAQDVWNKILSSIEKRLNQKNFSTWIRPLKLLDFSGDTAIIGVPDRFTRDWIKDHGFKDILQEEFSSLSTAQVQVVLRITDEPREVPLDKEEILALESKQDDASKKPVDVSRSLSDTVRDVGLNPRYTFDQFVVGNSNQFAFASCMSVAENPGTSYNPLFIYGGAGLGKTHLLNAVGHRVLELNSSRRVIYVTTETFTNEFINTIRFMKTDKFREKYRDRCDILLVDDIQFIADKDRTQEEFFHTFNTLYESRRQIVITSDRYPHEIPGLEDRLKTRFQWGIIADIQPPDIETRIAIIQKKADVENLDIPDDVAMFIASSAKSSIREIEGSLKRLGAFSSMYGKPITLDFAREILKDTLGGQPSISISDVQKVVANYFNIKISDLTGDRRHRSVSRPRQIAMFICRKVLNFSFPDIGLRFNKDHSSVIAATRNIENLINQDNSIRDSIESIKRQLGF
ncbi:MAG: chromosomal replication initiator protein DnaA [Myxococcales bacterium]|nr:chromosomal replication initiator protein DnaA [Myxococcales bacterium]